MTLARPEAGAEARPSILVTLTRELARARQARLVSNPFGYLFIAPAVILYLVFSVWPMFRGFVMAFTDYRFIYPKTQWDFNGLANFAEMLGDKVFWSSLGISVRYTLIVTPTTIVLSLLLAALIGRVRHLAGFYRWVIYLPVILPIAVTLLMWGQFYGNKFGFINVKKRKPRILSLRNKIDFASLKIHPVKLYLRSLQQVFGGPEGDSRVGR